MALDQLPSRKCSTHRRAPMSPTASAKLRRRSTKRRLRPSSTRPLASPSASALTPGPRSATGTAPGFCRPLLGTCGPTAGAKCRVCSRRQRGRRVLDRLPTLAQARGLGGVKLGISDAGRPSPPCSSAAPGSGAGCVPARRPGPGAEGSAEVAAALIRYCLSARTHGPVSRCGSREGAASLECGCPRSAHMKSSWFS
jgi:hypothetical protein